MKQDDLCAVEGCVESASGHGMCLAHYKAAYGRPDVSPEAAVLAAARAVAEAWDRHGYSLLANDSTSLKTLSAAVAELKKVRP